MTSAGRLKHHALHYRSTAEYVVGILSFVRAGAASGEPAFVAVPEEQLDWVRPALGEQRHEVRFADMSKVGRNPSRIIPAIQSFVDEHPGRRVRFVGEPIWPGRTDEEAAEATRHEALINLAFKDAGVSILCPYDTCSLSASVVAGSARTHPSMIERGTHRFSSAYSDPSSVLDGAKQPLPELPPPDESLQFGIGRLRQVRDTVKKHARFAGLSPERTHELVVSVNELATNTLTHTPGEGKLSVWNNPGSLLCEVTDGGRLTDPLAGRRTPPPGAENGMGLWLVNQLCDLVEIRSDGTGTTIRVRMYKEP